VFTVFDSVEFSVSVTDSLFNPIPDFEGLVHLWVAVADSDTNHFSGIPDSLLIEGARDTLSIVPRVAGSNTRIIGSFGETIEDTSYALEIVSGPPDQLLVLFPGEEILPGDTITGENRQPGKQGDAVTLYVGVPVELTVVLVDTFWNPVDDVGDVLDDSIHVEAVPEIYGISDGPKAMGALGSLTFSYTFTQDARGDAFFLEAIDLDDTTYNSYLVMYSVDLMAEYMGAWVSALEVAVGEYDTVWVQLLTANNIPVPGREVRFELLYGHGTLIPTIAYTSESGRAFSTYYPDLGSSGETVSIRAQAYKMPGLDTTQVLTEVVEFSIAGVKIEGAFGVYPNPVTTATQEAVFLYDIPNDPTVDRIVIEIYDPFGERVWKIERRPPEEGALLGRRNQIPWDGRNERGLRVASGVYLVSFRVYGGNRVYLSSKLRLGVVW
jgi:hypothetical protein